jgi:hypothetical protein
MQVHNPAPAAAPQKAARRTGNGAAKSMQLPPATSKPAKKIRMVRDSISVPKAEYLVLAEMKQRAAELTVAVRKTELLRAGIKVLAALPNAAFLEALRAVPNLKTGRPAKSV